MSEKPYYVLIDQKQAGPFSLAQLQGMWSTGAISAQNLFWQQDQADWQPLEQIAKKLGAPPPAASEHLLPTTPPPPPLPASPPRYQAYQARRSEPAGPAPTCGMAIASLVCGILGLFSGITAVFAIIFGHIARGQIRESAGALAGKGMATAGLVMGYGVCLLTIGLIALLIAAGVALPIFGAVQEKGLEIKDLSNAKQIATAILLYEIDHSGRTPANLAALVPAYIPNDAIFHSPLAPAGDTTTLGYDLMLPNIDAHALADPENTVLIRGHFHTRHHRVYVHADGSGLVKDEP